MGDPFTNDIMPFSQAPNIKCIPWQPTLLYLLNYSIGYIYDIIGPLSVLSLCISCLNEYNSTLIQFLAADLVFYEQYLLLFFLRGFTNAQLP